MILNFISRKFYALSSRFDMLYVRYWNWRWRNKVEEAKEVIKAHLAEVGVDVLKFEYHLDRWGTRDWTYFLRAYIDKDTLSVDECIELDSTISKAWYYDTPDAFMNHFLFEVVWLD